MIKIIEDKRTCLYGIPSCDQWAFFTAAASFQYCILSTFHPALDFDMQGQMHYSTWKISRLPEHSVPIQSSPGSTIQKQILTYCSPRCIRTGPWTLIKNATSKLCGEGKAIACQHFHSAAGINHSLGKDLQGEDLYGLHFIKFFKYFKYKYLKLKVVRDRFAFPIT